MVPAKPGIDWKALPLRERKFAHTKLALLDAALARLPSKPFAEITVKDLCAEVEVSEPTFFNYFPTRNHLLVYFVELWSLAVQLQILRLGREAGAIRAVDLAFEITGREIGKRPQVMFEIISWKVLTPQTESWPEVTRAERLLRFPAAPEVLDLRVASVGDIVERHVRLARKRGELPSNVDVALARTCLVAMFYGIPLALGLEKHTSVVSTYRSALAQFWQGLRRAR